RDMQRRLPVVADVRGIGLLLGVELVDPATRAPARDVAERVLYECLANGLSFKVGQGNVLVLAPPLVIDDADLDRALDIVERAIVACAS
ncbi:MAG TPA: aminotransferase class III-fold pyridoxal phosphate-dependent enzyme, partial [Casimicrobiaceae bacterium]|nr:aminotransferase class III-fold pyridoxal phosphate-dependent enzyme [Casimicrobiaceae bacterium]